MPVVTIREGTGAADENYIFYLNGWADLPFCSQGLDPVPDRFRVTAWAPPPPEQAAELVSVERANRAHLAQTLPAGRVTLVGYSHGGLGALDAARQLTSVGVEVRLVILDSVSPQTFLRLPLEVEFCTSAPFFAPEGGPLVEELRETQQRLTRRAPTTADYQAAMALVARHADHMVELAADFDPALATLDPGALVEKMTDWFCFLLLLRSLGAGQYTGTITYIHSREGRENALRHAGDEDHEVTAWRAYAPALDRQYVGDRHWGLLTDPDVYQVIFRI